MQTGHDLASATATFQYYILHGGSDSDIRVGSPVRILPEGAPSLATFTVDPRLPRGLQLCRQSGEITGIPTSPVRKKKYKIRATIDDDVVATADLTFDVVRGATASSSFSSASALEPKNRSDVVHTAEAIPIPSPSKMLAEAPANLPVAPRSKNIRGINPMRTLSSVSKFKPVETRRQHSSIGSPAFDVTVDRVDSYRDFCYFIGDFATGVRANEFTRLVPMGVPPGALFSVENPLPDGLAMHAASGEVSGIPKNPSKEKSYRISAESNSVTVVAELRFNITKEEGEQCWWQSRCIHSSAPKEIKRQMSSDSRVSNASVPTMSRKSSAQSRHRPPRNDRLFRGLSGRSAARLSTQMSARSAGRSRAASEGSKSDEDRSGFFSCRNSAPPVMHSATSISGISGGSTRSKVKIPSPAVLTVVSLSSNDLSSKETTGFVYNIVGDSTRVFVGKPAKIVPFGAPRKATFTSTAELPAGLVLDNRTGIIAGVPLQRTQMRTYEITAVENETNVTCSFSFYVEDRAINPSADVPSSASFMYKASEGFDISKVDQPVKLVPINVPQRARYALDTELPPGLSLDMETGIIEGKPHQEVRAFSTMVYAMWLGFIWTADVSLNIPQL